MVGAATAIRERGDFSGLRSAPPFREWFAGAGSLPADEGVHGSGRIVLELVQQSGAVATKERSSAMSGQRADEPEDITRLLVERIKAGDAEGVAALYEPDSVLAFPPGRTTVGREAIRAVYEGLIAQKIEFKPEEPLPTLRIGDLALTATRVSDEAGDRVQVARRQSDGSWLRILDRPDFRG